MAVTIGHASIDERGKASGGKAGDQTGKEVCTRPYYDRSWIGVYRPKNTTIANKIASTMEAICANNNIGYDQGQRTTLFEQAKKVNWNISKITTPCECDCSSAIAVCVNAAGLPISKDIYTGNQRNALMGTNQFLEYTDPKYLKSDSYLKRGDILLAKGHTVVVLSNGVAAGKNPTPKPVLDKTDANESKSVTAANSAKSFDKTLSGTYKVVTESDPLTMRSGAGKNFPKMVAIPKGTSVTNYGYYTTADGVKWMYVVATVGNIKYTGFCSGKYLKKTK